MPWQKLINCKRSPDVGGCKLHVHCKLSPHCAGLLARVASPRCHIETLPAWHTLKPAQAIQLQKRWRERQVLKGCFWEKLLGPRPEASQAGFDICTGQHMRIASGGGGRTAQPLGAAPTLLSLALHVTPLTGWDINSLTQ